MNNEEIKSLLSSTKDKGSELKGEERHKHKSAEHLAGHVASLTKRYNLHPNTMAEVEKAVQKAYENYQGSLKDGEAPLINDTFEKASKESTVHKALKSLKEDCPGFLRPLLIPIIRLIEYLVPKERGHYTRKLINERENLKESTREKS